MKLTDISNEVDKVEIDISDDDETATVVLTTERGAITVTGRVTIVERPAAPKEETPRAKG